MGLMINRMILSVISVISRFRVWKQWKRYSYCGIWRRKLHIKQYTSKNIGTFPFWAFSPLFLLFFTALHYIPPWTRTGFYQIGGYSPCTRSSQVRQSTISVIIDWLRFFLIVNQPLFPVSSLLFHQLGATPLLISGILFF